ncbi:hypothetical protein L9F63_001022 [Diploptera punctata]|uniref:F-box domain-containing protein n=1 Tax=Diploptera punctata TaxID=6984 RepID=A0AAD8ALA2_DIPPU|nr:hypothetical protein L9F63_001022 [Diploptera punctata]
MDNLLKVKEKRDDDFEKWLNSVSEKFKNLSEDQQLTTFRSLLEKSSPSQRYCLSNEINKILSQDIVSSLPTELLEQICHYIDAKSLVTACGVCKEWNGLISSLNEVWRRKCHELGIGRLKDPDVNWKTLCVTTLRQLEGLRTGLSFQHQDIRATCLTLEQITGVDYCNGYLIASADDQVGIWLTDDYELIGLIAVNKRISCLKVEDLKTIVCGHSTGHISIWCLKVSEYCCEAICLNEFYAHTGVIMSVCLCTDIDLILSGGTDFTAKIWCLSTGNLVKCLSNHTHWVIQVALLPTMTEYNDTTLFKGKHSLMTKTRDHVRVFSWPTSSQDGSVYGDMSEIENCVVEIALNPIQNFYTPGCHVHNGNIAYIKQSMVKDHEDGNAEIVLDNIATGSRVCEVHLKRKVRKLLAIGERFALVLLPHSLSDKHNLLVVEVTSGLIVGGCHLPHSSSTTPDLAQVAVGETGWLNGLEKLKPRDVVVALGMLNGQIRVVTWRDIMDKLTG